MIQLTLTGERAPVSEDKRPCFARISQSSSKTMEINRWIRGVYKGEYLDAMIRIGSALSEVIPPREQVGLSRLDDREILERLLVSLIALYKEEADFSFDIKTLLKTLTDRWHSADPSSERVGGIDS